MTLDELKTHKKILILGYGIEGKSSERFLKKFHPDAQVSIADQKDGDDYLDSQGDYDLVIKTPGIRKELITQKYTTATNIVLELSSYQLEDAQYSPHIACIINIFHELHNHLSYEEYFSAKARIIAFQNNNDYFFYNDKQSELTTLAKNTPATSIT